MAGAKRISYHAVAAQKEQLARRFQRFSVVEYEATRYAARMVQVLVEIALDPTVDVSVRRLCALDVIERSDGKVAQKIQIQQTNMDPQGITLDQEVEAATQEAAELAEAERWISSGLDPAVWPEAVRDRFGPEALLAFSGGETSAVPPPPCR